MPEGQEVLLNNLIMDIKELQHTGFIGAYLATKADDVGKHDRSQSPSLGLPRSVRCDAHGSDYAARASHLSNRVLWRC